MTVAGSTCDWQPIQWIHMTVKSNTHDWQAMCMTIVCTVQYTWLEFWCCLPVTWIYHLHQYDNFQDGKEFMITNICVAGGIPPQWNHLAFHVLKSSNIRMFSQQYTCSWNLVVIHILPTIDHPQKNITTPIGRGAVCLWFTVLSKDFQASY